MSKVLKIFTDGGARGNPGLAGTGVYVEDERGETVFQQGNFIGHATNNEAEYKAVLTSLEWLKEAQTSQAIDEVQWYLDSKLVVEQLNRNWKIKEERLQVFATQIWQQLRELIIPYSFSHVPRAQNKYADALVNRAIDDSLSQ